MKRPIFIGLGANLVGRSGCPANTLRHCIATFRSMNIVPSQASSLYLTAPVGGGRQPAYLNAVVEVTCSFGPAYLLRVFKRIERSAGRRRNRLNGPRPLDIDILDYGGHVLGRPGVRRPNLVLPHPALAHRRFVLIPLLEVAPAWYHPALHRPGTALLSGLSRASGAVQRILDSSWVSCDQVGPLKSASGGLSRISAPDRAFCANRHARGRHPTAPLQGAGSSCRRI